MDFEFEDIRAALQNPLPGKAAHLEMAPGSRIESLLVETPEQIIHARRAAVLILLYPVNEKVFTVLIKRPVYDGVHSGQIAFPGGRYEPEDRNLTETALREAEEETGIDRNEVNVLGILSELYIPPSNFLILPVVGYMNRKPDFKIQVSEVAGLLHTPLSDLFDERIRSVIPVNNGDLSFQAPSYLLDQEVIWGATAMVINEFYQVISKGRNAVQTS